MLSEVRPGRLAIAALVACSVVVVSCRQPELTQRPVAAGKSAASPEESTATRVAIEVQRPRALEPDLVGRRVYRDGIGSSGEPVQAIVAGDVAFEGTQFNCVNCHQKSGLGSTEGDVIAPMIMSSALYREKTTGPRLRPAYTDETLARAIRDGVDPSGHPFDQIMPRYRLSDRDMDSLVAYLKQLSATPSPGVTGEVLHFATVVAGDVDAGPMLAVLETFFRDKNSELRNPRGRRRSGPFYRRNVDLAYRTWQLHRWTLSGARETWRRQLEDYYSRQPVFALISGMSVGGWGPIHDFCEARELPCLLPNTDLPPASSAGEYTVYFSRGLFLEAGAVARDLARRPRQGAVLQVYPAGSPLGDVAGLLRHAVADRGGPKVLDLELTAGTEVHAESFGRKLRDADASTVVLWLGPAELEQLAPVLSERKPETRFYVSSTLLGGSVDAVPAVLRERTALAHPFCLEDDFELRFRRAALWMWGKGIPLTDRRIMAQTYFACMLAGEALMHVKFDYYFRDFFLENVDHTRSQMAIFCASHPAPSFGPGQRYLSKGCYILSPSPGVEGGRRTEWIVPDNADCGG